MYQKRSEIRYILILFFDLLCVLFSMTLAYLLRYGNFETSKYNGEYFYEILITALLVYVCLKLLIGIDYEFYTHGAFVEFLYVARNNILMFSGITSVSYLLKKGENYSRLAVIYFLIINTFMMYVVHLLLKIIIPLVFDRFANKNRVLLICDSEWAETIKNDLAVMKDYDGTIIGAALIDDSKVGEIAGVPVVSDISGVVEYCQKEYLDQVIVASSRSKRKELLPYMNAISEMGITIHYHMSVPELTGAKHKTLMKMGNHYMMTYATRIVSGTEMFIKRFMDIVGGIIGFIILIVLTLILAPIIKLESPGPVFFSQKRVGRNGRYFKMYKFRSMIVDAEDRLDDLKNQNEMNGLMFKMEDDPRITKVGRILRKTSLDEFPQFFNVLKGDMSLVGTRPPTVDEFMNYSPYHKKRLSFRPGITGLWQVSGRNDIKDFDDVVSLDVEYIDNWSPWLDLKILIKTIGKMFTGV